MNWACPSRPWRKLHIPNSVRTRGRSPARCWSRERYTQKSRRRWRYTLNVETSTKGSSRCSVVGKFVYVTRAVGSSSLAAWHNSRMNCSAPRKTNLPSTLGRPSPSRLSGVTLVLTLQSQRNEDHLPYLSQSEYPGKGTPVGRRSDDPRRKHTGDANTGHSARGRDRRERRVPGSGHLAHAVLSLGATSQSLWRRGVASASSGCSRRLSLSTGG